MEMSGSWESHSIELDAYCSCSSISSVIPSDIYANIILSIYCAMCVPFSLCLNTLILLSI